MKIFLFTLLLFAQQATGTALSLRVLDADHDPISGVEIKLVLYIYEGQEATPWFEARCETDLDGACAFEIENAPPDGGILRGTVQVGDFGLRDVIWPGGLLELTIRTDQIGVGREAAPYEFQEEDGGVRLQKKKNLLYAPVLLVLLAFLIWQVYLAAKSQEKNQ